MMSFGCFVILVIYFSVDDDEQDEREQTIDDEVAVGQVQLESVK